MSSSLCQSCNEKIYIKDIIEGCRPGVLHNNKYYCNQCIEAIYFCEDLEDNTEPKETVSKKRLKTKSSLLCPYCKIKLEDNSQNCSKCEKKHPFYIPKKFKKRKRKK